MTGQVEAYVSQERGGLAKNTWQRLIRPWGYRVVFPRDFGFHSRDGGQGQLDSISVKFQYSFRVVDSRTHEPIDCISGDEPPLFHVKFGFEGDDAKAFCLLATAALVLELGGTVALDGKEVSAQSLLDEVRRVHPPVSQPVNTPRDAWEAAEKTPQAWIARYERELKSIAPDVQWNDSVGFPYAEYLRPLGGGLLASYGVRIEHKSGRDHYYLTLAVLPAPLSNPPRWLPVTSGLRLVSSLYHQFKLVAETIDPGIVPQGIHTPGNVHFFNRNTFELVRTELALADSKLLPHLLREQRKLAPSYVALIEEALKVMGPRPPTKSKAAAMAVGRPGGLRGYDLGQLLCPLMDNSSAPDNSLINRIVLSNLDYFVEARSVLPAVVDVYKALG